MPVDPFASLMSLPGVFEAVDVARAGVDALLKESVLRRHRPEVRTESLRRGAWASAVLEGADVPLVSFEPPFPVSSDGRLCAAALRLSAELRSLGETWQSAPMQALARAHTLVAHDVVDADELGRPRPDPEVSTRLAQLADVLAAPTEGAAVVVAAVVHAELLVLRPFGWGNGLVARAAQRLVLIERGVDPDALSVPEAGLLELGHERYASALDGYRSGSAEGVAGWLVHVASSVARGAAAGREVCAAV
ncbi:MAG: oxidoreductase [Actinomycetes bacterium]